VHVYRALFNYPNRTYNCWQNTLIKQSFCLSNGWHSNTISSFTTPQKCYLALAVLQVFAKLNFKLLNKLIQAYQDSLCPITTVTELQLLYSSIPTVQWSSTWVQYTLQSPCTVDGTILSLLVWHIFLSDLPMTVISWRMYWLEDTS